MTTDNVKPDSQLRFHGQAQHSLQSSRTTSEFAIKWSQAEHCTLPPVSASALMLPMLLSIHSFLQLTDAQQGRGISPFLCYGYGHITVMIMFTLASKLIRVQLKISGHHRSRDCDPPLHSSFLIRGGVSPALLCHGDGCSEVVQ